MDVEAQRLSNLQYKQKLLADLNLDSISVPGRTKQALNENHVVKKRRVGVDAIPTRASARISSSTRPSYKEDDGPKTDRTNVVLPKGRTRIKSISSTTPPSTHLSSETLDEMIARWTAWSPTGPQPLRSERNNVFHFQDQPTFTPNKSPAEMLREGCFGGSYFRPLRSRKLGILVQNDWKELPENWIQGLDPRRYLISPDYDPKINKYGVACGQSIEEWEAAGWIAHDYDVRGWFQWYCRFFQGRRCEDDDRQVSRWRKCVGETGRWRRMLLKKYLAMGVREVFDDGEDEDTREVSPVMHQTCHHWAYEVRQEDLDRAWGGGN